MWQNFLVPSFFFGSSAENSVIYQSILFCLFQKFEEITRLQVVNKKESSISRLEPFLIMSRYLGKKCVFF